MSRIYNALICTTKSVICTGSHLSKVHHDSSKLKLFMDGQANWRKELHRDLPAANGRCTYWFHAASLGEYGVIRPVIRRISSDLKARVVLTFFSSTGYTALKPRTDLPEIDYIGYLPLDTPDNVTDFLDVIKPDCAVFAVSEYWINYLHELHHRHIPTYLISALITQNAPFFKWWGKPYRDILDCYTNILVLTQQSRIRLSSLGYTRAVMTGDPLFDNASVVASTPWRNKTIEQFAPKGSPLFIAGSISDEKDLKLCAAVAHEHPDLKCLFVPHEITQHHLDAIAAALPGRTVKQSECKPGQDLSDKQVLIIDSMGELAYLYRYGSFAYIGGGFTPKLHSIIEATVYGLPTSFGPQIQRKATAQELMRLGIGHMVETPEQINQWVDSLTGANASRLESLADKARSYAESNCGATDKIVKLINVHKGTI